MWFDLVKAANGDSVNCFAQIHDALTNLIATHPIMIGAAITLDADQYISLHRNKVTEPG
jgi:hypothetical protein